MKTTTTNSAASMNFFKAVIFTVFIILSVGKTFSQSDWLNTHNSGGANPDDSYYHAIDNQGNTYVTGYGAPGGYPNGLLIKISPTGNIVWSKNFYGYNGGNAIGKKILIDQSGNVYVCAEGTSYGSSWDFWLYKFDSNGNNLFSVRYGEPAYNESFGDAIFDAAGNILVTVSGRTYSDSTYKISLIKYNTSCTPVLFQTYNSGTYNAYAEKLLKDNSGNIFMAGSMSSSQQTHSLVIVLKYNAQFQFQTVNIIGGSSPYITYFGDAEMMMNTDVVVSCSFPRSNGERDLTVVKLNNFLNNVWTKDFNIVSGQNELFDEIVIGANNNIYMAGYSDSYTSSSDGLAVTLNIDGSLLWSRVYDRNGNFDRFTQVGIDNFGNMYCAGTSAVGQNMDALIIKYDVNGTQQFVYNYNGLGFSTDIFKFMTVSPAGIITANGFTTNSSSGTDFLTVHLTGNLTGVVSNNSEIPSAFSLSQNYPNPFNPSTKISFSIPKSSFVKMAVYDITGKEVEVLVNENVNAGTFEVDFNASKLTSGVYFCKITAGDFTDVKKMILAK